MDVTKSLIIQKDRIEQELEKNYLILENYSYGPSERLVDSDGFPRADIDIHSVADARNKIKILKNDLRDVMEKIYASLKTEHG